MDLHDPDLDGSATAYAFTAPLWRHDGPAAWYFLTLPEDVSDDIDARTQGRRHGFGSVPVDVAVGRTRWTTSVFPDTRRGAYILPVKAAVRRAEGLDDGDAVGVSLALADG